MMNPSLSVGAMTDLATNGIMAVVLMINMTVDIIELTKARLVGIVDTGAGEIEIVMKTLEGVMIVINFARILVPSFPTKSLEAVNTLVAYIIVVGAAQLHSLVSVQ